MSYCRPSQRLAPIRPSAVPLFAYAPYFSIWSVADHLTDEGTRHWTGKPNSLSAAIRTDKTYEVMGRERFEPRGARARGSGWN